MDFGPAEFVHSQFLNKSLLKCKSKASGYYLYTVHTSKKTGAGEKSYFRCNSCRSVSERGAVSRVTVLWSDRENKIGRVVTDPDVNHVPGCEPLSEEAGAGKELQRTVYVAVRSGKRPIDAHHSTQSTIPKKAKLENLNHESLVANFPDRFEIERQLRRHQEHGIPRIHDPWDLPPSYKVTHVSDSENQERWLLHQNEELGILMFSSDRDLEVMKNSPIWFAFRNVSQKFRTTLLHPC